MATTSRITYIGGPTALLEIGGFRLLTDPGFDAVGTRFESGAYVLTKTKGPAANAEALLPIDAVLLSHDHHFDNLDGSGRSFLPRARRVITTRDGATRLADGNTTGLLPWESTILGSGDEALKITATPARHGPNHGDRGPVIGFLIQSAAKPDDATYISGDTVYYEGIEEIARRFHITRAVLFMGAARVAAVGPDHLTFTAEEGVAVARLMPDADIVPLHFEGWEHFTEGHDVITKAFGSAGLEHRLHWAAEL
jgi:L-ascorbate metabolism protein UlaG (beta-lactamase superfamily)